MKGSSASWRAVSFLLVAAAMAVAVAIPLATSASDTLAWGKGLNAGAWSPGATLKVCVDAVPGDAPAGTSAAVDAAIAAWNTAQAPLGGLTLVRDDGDKANCDIHISWDANLASWGEAYPKDSTDRLRDPAFKKDTVRMTIDHKETQDGVALNANGIQGIIKHELGHAEGLAHSPLSPLMQKAAFSPGLGGSPPRPRPPTTSSLNNGGAVAVPVADDLEGKKALWGTSPKESRSTTPSSPGPYYDYESYTSLYRWSLYGELDCQSACTGPITDFAVEIPDGVLADGILTAPSGWNAQLIDARVSTPGPGEKALDAVLRGSSVAYFSAQSPGQGIQPGQTKEFVLETSVPPGIVRTFTGSPSWDSDEAFVTGPATPVGGLAELPQVAQAVARQSDSSAGNHAALAVGLAAAVALTAGAWYVRRRWLR